MLNVKALLLKIVDAMKADYIVEQGTSGIWTYRKWNSGIAECWGLKTGSYAINTSSAAYGGYRSAEITQAFPFTFTSVPVVSVTAGANSNGGWISNAQGTTTTDVKYLYSCGSSQSATNRTAHIYAIGTWK